MSRFLLFLLTILATGSVAFAADKPPARPHPEPPVTVILIPTDSIYHPPSPGSFSQNLSSALANHLGLILSCRGQYAEIKRSANPISPTEALAGIVSRENRVVVLLYYSALLMSKTLMTQDSHRRRFVTQTDACLELGISYLVFDRSISESTPITSGQVEYSGQPDRALGKSRSGAALCLPYDVVIQRALTEVSSKIPFSAPAESKVTSTIPVRVHLSPRVAGDRWVATEMIERIVGVASERLVRQFGLELNLIGIDTLPDQFATERELRESVPDFHKALRSQKDTLAVVFNRLLDLDEYGLESWRDEIGITRLGHRRIYMDLMAPFRDGDSTWYVIANGLTLLHEVGHVLGGMHVSDINSVMNHRANWVNADQFDPVNREILRAALSGELSFDDPVEYIRYISRILTVVPYRLADYPSFFYQYLNWGGNRRINEQLRSAIGRPSFLLATDGYGKLVAGEASEGAELLRQALIADPDQGALYYYLSLALAEPEGSRMRMAALRLGYTMAGESGGGLTVDGPIDINAGRR